MRVDEPGGGLDFGVGGVEPSIADVFPHRALEEVRGLPDDAELGLQPAERIVRGSRCR